MTPSPTPGAEARLALGAGIGCYLIWGFVPLVFQAIGHMGVSPWEIVAQRTLWAVPSAMVFVLAARVENVTDLTEDRLTDAGMMRTFAELVMRQPLRSVPRVERPEGIAVLPFEPATVPLFHRAAQESFADRPGFEAVELEPWAAQLRDDEAFQPALSRVALTADDRPVGFVTLSRDWVDQVGVIPQWRGRGLGGHLVARSLSALAKAGSSEVWLAVNVDNPAQELYRRLGFEDYGLRARYRDVPVD